MIICKISTFNLNPAVTIVNASYEVALDKEMTNLIASSYQDDVHTKSIIFDIIPEKGRTYYSRVSATLSSGPTEWGPVSEFVYDSQTVTLYLKTPSVISTPILSTIFQRTEHPNTCFTVKATNYNAIGDSQQRYAYWSIIDVLTGEVITHKRTDVELDSFFVDINLDYNRIYNINCMFEGDNDDFSERGSLTIITGGELIRNFSLSVVSTVEDFTLFKDTLSKPNSIHEWRLYDEDSNILTTASEEESTVSSFNIRAAVLEKGKTYLLRGRIREPLDLSKRWKYFTFRTESDLNYGLPKPFPYKLGDGGELTSEITIETDKE